MLHKILVTTIRSIVTVTFVWLFHVALSRKWFLNMAVVLYIANALIGIYSSIASDLLLLYLPKGSSPSVASGRPVAPKENSLKKIYTSEFLQSSFIFVIYLLKEVYRKIMSEIHFVGKTRYEDLTETGS